ncbi:MAG: DUF3120 domain-containing protein [Pseudanabaenaceae cyanobacterium]
MVTLFLILPRLQQGWLGLWTGILLVSLPVFGEAPLVRWSPVLGLLLSVGWLGLSRVLAERCWHWWASVVWGFSLSWGCGAIYWGWWRWFPAWHLVIESLAVPWAVWGWRRAEYRLGAQFYLGSLLGTALTDLYFYGNDLFGVWAELMAEESAAQGILPRAIAQVHSAWGLASMGGLVLLILALVVWHLRRKDAGNWLIAGTLIGTIAVDGLFYAGVLLMNIS